MEGRACRAGGCPTAAPRSYAGWRPTKLTGERRELAGIPLYVQLSCELASRPRRGGLLRPLAEPEVMACRGLTELSAVVSSAMRSWPRACGRAAQSEPHDRRGSNRNATPGR